MRAILDRHADVLTPEERRAIWQTISGPRAEKSRSRLPWALSGAVASAVVAVATFALLQREPAHPRHSATTGRAETTSKVENSAPGSDQVSPGAERAGAVRRGTQAGAADRTLARRDRASLRPDGAAQNGAHAVVVPEAVKAVPPPSPAATASMGAVTGRITDSQNQPVPYASVTVREARAGALSGEDGFYRIEGLPPATYSLQVQSLGHEKQVREGLRVEGDQTAMADIQMKDEVVKTLEEIGVTAPRRIDTRSSVTKQTISAEHLRQLPVDNLGRAIGTGAGVAPVVPAPPPVVPTTGGTRLPNDEPYDSMFFKNYGVNPFIPTDEDPLSTFAVDVDAASYTVARRYLELGNLPPADAVRVEEFVNFFPQGYPRFGSDDFRIVIDGAPSPFGPGYQLIRIGLKGREIEERNRKPARLTFVIDVSGSMGREDRLELVKRALRLLVDRLRDDDRVGIVVFGSEARVLLEPVAVGRANARAASVRPGSDLRGESNAVARSAGRRKILEAIEQLRPEGSTNTEHGMRLGYDMARRELQPQANNRIVLCSDGVANVGMTGPGSILERVRTEADRGIHLTTIGFGMGNYNDVLMEQLADKGDGNYYYVDDLDEARRVFVENLTGTLQTIARDAKIQVEFDSTRVLRYRLLGFENRDVADRDFRNDKVDAGEIGAGHEVTALYEVKLAPMATRGTIATVRLRYARPEMDRGGAPEVREIERSLDASALVPTFADAPPHFRLDAAVAEFAEILRGSYWAKDGRLSDVLSVARSAAVSLRDDKAAEFVSLVEKAAALSGPVKPEQRGEER